MMSISFSDFLSHQLPIFVRSSSSWSLDAKYLSSDDAFVVTKIMNDFGKTVVCATEKLEPNIISKTVMTLCKAINKFYTNEKVLTENQDETYSKCKLISMAREVIKFGLHLLCIETVETM